MYAPADVQNHLRNVLDWDGDTGWSTLAWLQNDVDWSPLTADPVLLQIFPKDNGWEVWEIAEKLGDCVGHAREEGFTYVGVTYQTYDYAPGIPAQPSWYDVGAFQHSTFPGNLIQAHQWKEWYA